MFLCGYSSQLLKMLKLLIFSIFDKLYICTLSEIFIRTGNNKNGNSNKESRKCGENQ